MHKAKQLLPNTLVGLISETIYDYYTYILDNFVLPTWIYSFVRVYISFSTCLLFTNFHQSGTGLKPLEPFLNLYATELTEKSALINFVIDMIAFIVIYVSIFYYAIIFTKKSHLSKISTYINVVFIEVVCPVLLLTTGSQIGNNVGLLYKNVNNYTVWVYTIFSAFWLIVTLIFMNTFLYSYIPFVPGRSVALSVELQGFETNVITAIRVLARSANATAGTKLAIAFRVAIALVLAYGIFNIIFWKIYHNKGYTSFIGAVFCAGFVLDVLGIFISLDWVIRILIFFTIIGVGDIVITQIVNAYTKKVKELFTALENEEITLEEIYPKINNSYLRNCYEAFRQGHPYYMTFKPIVYGAHNENTNSKVWRFYVRTLAIYNSRIYDLMNASQELKRLEFNDLKTQLFIRGIDHIIDIRSKKVSKQCSMILKNIQGQTRSLRSTLVKYWQAIQNGEPGGAYAYGSSAQKQMDEIERMYTSTLTKWPNVQSIYKHYAKFLINICFNRLKGEQYTALAQITRNVDMVEIRAKRTFPLIPMVLPDSTAANSRLPPVNDQGSMLSSGSVGASSELDRNEEVDAELSAQNTLYEMGKSASVPINRTVTLFTILSFIVLFILGVVLTDVLILNKYSIFNTLLEFLSCFTSVLFYSSRAVYRQESLILDELNVSYNTSMVAKIIDSEDPSKTISFRDQIVSDISNLVSAIDKMEALRSDTNQYTGNVSYLLTAMRVKMNFLYENISSGEVVDNKKFIPLLSGINHQAAVISEYYYNMTLHPNVTKRTKDFMLMVENNYRINDVLTELTNYISESMMTYTEDISTLALTMTIVFAAISVIIFPIAVILLKVQEVQYGHIIDSMHKIPTIVIIQHISELSIKSESEKNDSAETALQIQDSHGIPTCFVSLLVSICIIVFVGISFVNFYILTRSTDKFRVLPYQMKNGALLANHIYDQMSTIKRIWAVNAHQKLNADGSALVKYVYPGTVTKIENSVDEALFGEKNNITFGYLLVKSGSRQLFFNSGGGTGSSYHDFFLKFGYVFSLEVDMSELRYFSDFLKDPVVFSKDNTRLLTMMHYNDVHLSTGVLDNLVANTFVDINTAIDSQQTLAIATPVLGFLVLSLFLGAFIYFQMRVLSTFRFTIMSLSMLDQKYIQTNERLLDIATGNFTSDGQSDSIPSHYIECLKNSSTDAVIVTNKNFDIIEANNAAKSLSTFGNNAKNIEDIMGLPQELRDVAESSSPCMKSFQKSFKADNGKTYDMDITVTQSNDGAIVIIMHRDIIGENLADERAKTEQKLKNIIFRIIPHDFREGFGDSPFKTVLFENAIMFAVKAKNITFGPDDDDEKLQKVLAQMKSFHMAVVEGSKIAEDCAIVKKHNMSVILCFNLKNQKRTIQQPLAQAFEVLKKIKSECDKAEVKISAAVTFSRAVLIGIPSLNKANFNIFSPELATILKALDISQDDELLCSKIDRDIPQNLRDKVRQGDDFSHIIIADI